MSIYQVFLNNVQQFFFKFMNFAAVKGTEKTNKRKISSFFAPYKKLKVLEEKEDGQILPVVVYVIVLLVLLLLLDYIILLYNNFLTVTQLLQ